MQGHPESPNKKVSLTKVVSRITGTCVLGFNTFFFLPNLVKYIGWEIWQNNFYLFTLLWLIPAAATWISKNRNDNVLCVLNCFGFGWSTLVFLLLSMDIHIDNY